MPMSLPARLPMIVLLLASLPAFAGTPDPAGPAVRFKNQLSEPGLLQLDDRLMLSPGAAWYPEAEAATGAQGTAIVVMDLAPDGHVAAARIAVSSHAPALDEQAVQLASTLHWMGARRTPPQASLEVTFARDDPASVQKKSCAELNVDIAWMKTHDPAQPPEAVGALRTARGMVAMNTTWMPDRSDREALRPVRDALFVASRRTIAECAAHPDQRMKDVFNRLLHEAARAHEHEPATPSSAPAPKPGPLPRTILHTRRDDPLNAGGITVLGKDPAYPPAALATGSQGFVELRAEIGDDGAVDRIVVQQDSAGSPVLTDAARDIVRSKLADAHFEKRDPATLPPEVVISVVFQRNDADSIAAMDCATYRIDAAGWRGDLRQLPDADAMYELLLQRGFSGDETHARIPRKWATAFGAAIPPGELKALDAVCAAAPRKLAIDALIDVIDAAPPSP